MEQTNDEILTMKEDSNNSDNNFDNNSDNKSDKDIVVDCDFPSTTSDSTDNKSSSIIADHSKLDDKVLEDNVTNEKKRRRDEINEEKRIAQEEYNKTLHEQRYKRLMHLLTQSQFYSNYLMEKITSTSSQEIKDEKKATNENLPPKKKEKKKNTREYDIRQYISPKMEKKINSDRSKFNLRPRQISGKLLNLDTQVDNCENFCVPKYFNGTLYKYQREGLQWLKVLYENGLNGILADEMGLGKTIQIIALLCHLLEKHQSGPYLIIAPLSTIPNWVSEFKRFAPDLPIIVFHGSKNIRSKICKEITQSYSVKGEYRTRPIVLTTYEIPLVEYKFLMSQKWRYIIVDEGQRIKNHEALLSRILRTFPSMNRLLLTGTPLQNNLAELWSLLNFLLPDIFNDLAVFESWFNINELESTEATKKILKQEEEKHILSSLREILKPFVLRREKSDVHMNIPPKKELIVYAPLSHLQHEIYRAVLNYDLYHKIEREPILETLDGSKPKRKRIIRNTMDIINNSNNELTSPVQNEEGILTHPDLLEWKKHTNITDQNRDFLKNLRFQNRLVVYKKIVNHPYLLYNPLDLNGMHSINDDIIKSSGKLLVLDAMLSKLKKQGHKVLLFSTMTKLLNIIEDYLSLRNYKYVRLDGSSKLEERGRNIKRFNTDPGLFLFLISTKAGGTGLNLAAADTVIIYDSDWNPQVDIQAMARCHRIGQTRPVVIYKLCTKRTIDEAIIKRAEAKRLLEKMVMSKKLRKLDINSKDTLLELKQLLESKESTIVTSTLEEEELNELMDRSDMVHDNSASTRKFTY
ncbi:lymphoid-specific helicase-like isoform X2 [Vespula pensylvanica]|uniref:lymphoid-specific helicase-like isoform X2 n=1 Tax=Vespula pensylvanica TaxID=30213 RepID=UPI001CBA1DE3|nr:lymphoid-specific helicase-like isoform X2 [Vespula pensylvanica]